MFVRVLHGGRPTKQKSQPIPSFLRLRRAGSTFPQAENSPILGVVPPSAPPRLSPTNRTFLSLSLSLFALLYNIFFSLLFPFSIFSRSLSSLSPPRIHAFLYFFRSLLFSHSSSPLGTVSWVPRGPYRRRTTTSFPGSRVSTCSQPPMPRVLHFITTARRMISQVTLHQKPP